MTDRPEDEDAKQPLVLVVDDEQLANQNAVWALEKGGFSCLSAASGEECLRILDSGYLPDTILMDIYLGQDQPDGIETAEQIFNRWDIPVVFLSGYTDADTIGKIERVQRYGCIQKCPGNEQFIVTSVHTALKLKRHEQQLQKKNRFVTTILENTSDVIVRSDPELRHLYANPQLYQRTGYTREQYIGKTNEELGMPPALCRQLRQSGNKALKSGKPVKDVFSFDSVDRGRCWFQINNCPEFDEAGNPVSLLSFIRDITELKNSQDELARREELLQSILSTLTEGILVYNTGGELLYSNARAEEILACSAQMISHIREHQHCFRLLRKDDSSLPISQHPAVITLTTGKPKRSEIIRIERKDGKRIWLSMNSEPLWSTRREKLVGAVASFRDISRDRRREERLISLAEEREHLLMEINHRVKNNLFTVEALANVERSDKQKSKDDALQDIIDRVRAISLVHEKLYTTEHYASVEVSSYLRELIRALQSAHSISSKSCSITLKADPIRLPPKKITALGLIISELMSNSIKHAGCPAAAPIEIKLKKENKVAVLDYRDSGPGFPPGVKSIKDISAGTGIQLMQMLARDLEGELKIFKETTQGGKAAHLGAHFHISFPLK